MKEAIEQFRSPLEAAINTVEFVKRALDRQYPKTTAGKVLPDLCCGASVSFWRECEVPSLYVGCAAALGT